MANKVDTKLDENIKNENDIKFKGHFVAATGGRKSAIATVRLYKKGTGIITINNKKSNNYFPGEKNNLIRQPLKLAGGCKDINISIFVKGGGVTGQTDAIKHALSKALVKLDHELKPILKSKKLLTRDSRIKERKKPGLKKARRAPQWAKR